MVAIFYDILFVLSLVLTLVYALIWHKHFSIYITLIFTLIPITNLGFAITANAAKDQNIDAALIGTDISYIGGCFLVLFILLSVFNLCKLNMPKWLSMILLSVCALIYLCVLTIRSDYGIFYKSATFITTNGTDYFMKKEYGPAHTVFIIMVITYFLISLLAMCYTYFVKTDVSSSLLFKLFLPELVCVMAFFVGRSITDKLEFLPMAYVFAQIMYLIIIHRVCLYDITDTGIDSIIENGDTGFVSFDFKYDFLGSNETANAIFPTLRNLTVDEPISSVSVINDLFMPWLERFKADENDDINYYKKDDKIYMIDVNYLYNGKHKRGYQFFITDDTANQKLIDVLNNYNSDLENQVEQKTANLVEMHNRLILSMATMVESRDNSTGGHIKRTSEVVKLLMDEIMKDNTLGLSNDFCKNIIKAAPMHDLGKIAVDDAILRKPGRFEPQEFEKMKAHAAEGARIVHQILEGTEDIDFHIIAENVAQYHHERWDGSGYPEGLKGDDIPIEARIMAIADVYDALVSKRVYKDAMSFSQADQIIMEGMGRHFDRNLEKYYVAARPAIESYYSSLNEEIIKSA
ncbi:MAG: HD domain-containing protein [Lachnospiraceae bacterium]|nr:HD domain-containing protein [Lachnospiraceae bacterium]